jgi:hypothetical protein
MFNIIPGMSGLGYVKDLFTRCWDISNSTLGRWETGQYDQIEDDIEKSANTNLKNAKGEFGTLKAPKDYKESQFTQNGTSNFDGPGESGTTSSRPGKSKSKTVLKGNSKSMPTASHKPKEDSMYPTRSKGGFKPTPTRSSNGDKTHSVGRSMTSLVSASSKSPPPVQEHTQWLNIDGVITVLTEHHGTASSTVYSPSPSYLSLSRPVSDDDDD